MISAFGIQHGEISKADKSNKKRAAVAAGGTAAAGGAYLGAVNSKKGSAYLDNRAMKIAEELVPSGTRFKGKNGKIAITSNYPVDMKGSGGIENVKHKLGYRKVETSLRGVKGEHIGAFESQLAPTKHVKATYGKITNRKNRGLGFGSQFSNTAVNNARGAKIPSLKFLAASYGVGNGKKPTGDIAWRKPGISFSSIGYHPYAAVNVRRGTTTKQARNAGYKHIARAALKLDKPKDISKLPMETQNALRGVGWLGRAKGAQPFLGRTKYAVGGAAAAAGAMHLHNKQAKNRRKK